ncbi:hypothetical protein V6N13_115999 [Hibiscus sabdariffa]
MNPPYPLVGNGAPLTMECETLAALKPMISYKDMVIGGNVSPSPEEPIDLDDDDIELLGEDISSDLDSMQHDAIPLSAYTETNPPTDPFGPWVVVERRKRVSRSVNVKKHAGSKVTNPSHVLHVASMQGSCEHTGLANSSSSKGQSSTAVSLDCSKHQTIRHTPNSDL